METKRCKIRLSFKITLAISLSFLFAGTIHAVSITKNGGQLSPISKSYSPPKDSIARVDIKKYGRYVETVPFIMVDSIPSFPGGQTEMTKFITSTMKYPTDAMDANILGSVLVRFVVRKDGTIRNPKVLKSVDPILDNEALRVVGAMPNWLPGKRDDEYVDVYFTVPIVFQFNDYSPKKAITPIVIQKEENKSKQQLEEERGELFILTNDGPIPSFPGGETAMLNFIALNTKYPQAAIDANIQGTVLIRFVVREDGVVQTPEVEKGVNSILDNEAIRVIKSMPNWVVDEKKKKNMDVCFTIPFVFGLDNGVDNDSNHGIE